MCWSTQGRNNLGHFLTAIDTEREVFRPAHEESRRAAGHDLKRQARAQSRPSETRRDRMRISGWQATDEISPARSCFNCPLWPESGLTGRAGKRRFTVAHDGQPG
ncbi:hypothetical protein [Kibdelosporangium philippinense]|uniref:hypothetical protein n=1 Tax=Kibdelosporangium philippinense TaxID=211113 RepID=UPI00361D7649